MDARAIKQAYRRYRRLLFISGLERKFRRTMGVWWFLQNRVTREHRVYYWQKGKWRYSSIDFAIPSLRLGFEIDHPDYHPNTIRDFHRDLLLKKLGWEIIRITAKNLKNPRRVEQSVKREVARRRKELGEIRDY